MSSDLSASDVDELRALIPDLMAPALPELRVLDPTRVTIELLLIHARRRLEERHIRPARERDAFETAMRHR